MITEAEVDRLLESLPVDSFLRRYVLYGKDITDAHTAYHVAGALSLLSVTAPLSLVAKYAGNIRPAMFSLLCGPSTTSRKTSCVRLAREMLERVDPSYIGCVPGSWEGLIESIRMQPRQLIPYEEFGHLMAAAFDGYMRKIKTGYNQLVDGSPLERVTVKDKGKKLEPVRTYNVGLLCAIAPALLEAHTELVDWTGGFLGRFLILDCVRNRNYGKPSISPAREIDLDNALREKLTKPSVGKFLGIDGPGEEHLIAFAQDVEAIKSEVPETAHVSLARSQQIAVKIAMLLTWDYGEASGGGNDWRITEREVGPAIQIAKMHMVSAVSISQRLSTSADMRDRRKVLEHIPRTGSVPFGHVLLRAQMLRPRGKVIVETLIEEGSIRCSSPSGKSRQEFTREILLPEEVAGDRELTDLVGTGRVGAALAVRDMAKHGGQSVEVDNVVPLRRGEPEAPFVLKPVDQPVVGRVADRDTGSASIAYDPEAPLV